MARFFVGQRVKKVSGVDVGNTGTIEYFAPDPRICPTSDVAVRWDNAGPSCGGHGWSCAGEIATTHTKHLEPILDQKHEACDEDFKRDLDRLLERQGVAA